MRVDPVVLTGKHVQLEPVGESHIGEMWAAAGDRDVWTFIPTRMESEEDMGLLVRHGMHMAEAGLGIGFAQRALADGQVAGGTGYWAIDTQHRRLEVGFTWLHPRWQRTAINTEAKYLLLRHAFEELGCIRVEFKTDSRNAKSRAALERIGAVEEGTFRNHMIMLDGVYRHSAYYSIIDTEWPAVKQRLESKLS